MRYITLVVAFAGLSACDDSRSIVFNDEQPEECLKISDAEVDESCPHGTLAVKTYLRYGGGLKLQIWAPVQINMREGCLKGITPIEDVRLAPMSAIIDCQDVTNEDELARIEDLTGVKPGFSSPRSEERIYEIADGGGAHIECFYNTE
jgi:hypothetical protein